MHILCQNQLTARVCEREDEIANTYGDSPLEHSLCLSVRSFPHTHKTMSGRPEMFMLGKNYANSPSVAECPEGCPVSV